MRLVLEVKYGTEELRGWPWRSGGGVEWRWGGVEVGVVEGSVYQVGRPSCPLGRSRHSMACIAACNCLLATSLRGCLLATSLRGCLLATSLRGCLLATSLRGCLLATSLRSCLPASCVPVAFYLFAIPTQNKIINVGHKKNGEI